MLPLTYRRDILFRNHCFYYDIIDVNKYVTFTSSNLCQTRKTADSTKLCVSYCRTEGAKLFYFKRIVRIWNNLPVEIRVITYVHMFKGRVVNYIYNMLTFSTEDYSAWPN